MLSHAILEDVSAEHPAVDEVEVSLFGPGLGECVVVHLGNAEWMVVDSCVRAQESTPIALEYLEKLGVDIGASITTIVASHWHDDHVTGISDIFERAHAAKFYAASALSGDEFRALTMRKPVRSRFSSGVSELGRVRELVESRKGSAGGHLSLVSAGRRIRNRRDSPVSEIWSLSPSDTDLLRGIDGMAAALGSANGGVSRVATMDANDLSVVLQLETVAGSILLGGDLENRGDVTRGWRAVVRDANRPPGMSSLYKIPHHGSRTADSDEIWQQLIKDDALCILAPYERGVIVPGEKDIDKLRSRSSNIYITSQRKRPAVHRDPAVAKMINQATRSYSPNRLTMGHLQVRSNGGPWEIRGSNTSFRL
ncbi:MBL fold metallo-hydrolase [Streptomyces sp. NPDC051704]|uniref:MBL fold metallo-hydrolase n=1 Tax=Streptomyces sp. NPDC051704 TaxID=3365671 RepID=UPI00378B94FA